MSLTDVGPQAGFEAKLYIKISSTWTEMPQFQDVSGPDTNTKIATPCKGSRNKKYIQGQGDQSISGTYLWNKGQTDAVFAAIKAAKDAGTHVEIASADGDIATVGTVYVRDWYVVTTCSKNEDLDDAVTYDVEFSPTPHFASGTLVERSEVTVSS